MPDQELIKRIEKVSCEKRNTLTYSAKGLDECPPEIGNLGQLTSLDLSKNYLQKLPPEIGNLTNLRKLNLRRNYFKSWPKEIEKIHSITHLNLSENYIQVLPPEIDNLNQLISLEIAEAGIKMLPSEIGNLINLQTLDLRINQIEEVPKEIGKLKSLIRLDLSNTNLEHLPLEITSLDNLEWLDIVLTPLSRGIKDEIVLCRSPHIILSYILENQPDLLTPFADIDIKNDIFISYARENFNKAKLIVKLFEQEGWKVWWDRNLPPGKGFREIINKSLKATKCVVVLWSNESVESDWVLDEAEDGKERGILVPVLIDQIKPPLGFRQIQSFQLTDWTGTQDAQEVAVLLDVIRRQLRRSGSLQNL